MSFFSKLRERLTKSSSKIGTGLDDLIGQGTDAAAAAPRPAPEPAPTSQPTPAPQPPAPAPAPQSPTPAPQPLARDWFSKAIV